MPNQALPERQPLADEFSGVIAQLGDVYLLASEELESTETLAQGKFIIRYGIRFQGKPHISIVPDLVVLDYGDTLVNDDAWDFLVNDSNLHPRADVLGYRHDGEDAMLMVRDLDFGIPYAVFAFAKAEDRKPIAEVKALITLHADTLPERLLQYLPHYDSLADWQNAR